MKIKPEERDNAAISSNPPKMPKVLDVSAIQEILGVSIEMVQRVAISEFLCYSNFT